jgi:hypothetical protein
MNKRKRKKAMKYFDFTKHSIQFYKLINLRDKLAMKKIIARLKKLKKNEKST